MGCCNPLPGWTVRDLLNHLTAEARWIPSLLEGQTVEQVGDRFEGDLLGDDPAAAWQDAAAGALSAARAVDLDRTVHLSFGDVPAREYLSQIFADFLIHGWDLARAIGEDDRLDPELVDSCARWFAERETLYRAAGAIGERPQVADDASPQIRLLAAFGRRADWQPS